MHAVYIIAEIGINHGGDMDEASQLVVDVSACGADMAKFQYYDPVKILGKDSPHLKAATECQLTKAEHRILKRLCDSRGIEYGLSVFDAADVPFADSLVKRYKVASRAAKDRALLAAINKTRKPVILSCGLIDTSETRRAVGLLPDCDVTLLHCVPKYPTRLDEVDLHGMYALSGVCQKVGLSSHCPSVAPTLAAVARGAVCVENHVKHDFCDGPDSESSLFMDEFNHMVGIIRDMEKL